MVESLKARLRNIGRRWCSKPYCVALTGVLLAVCIFAQLAFAQSGLNDYEGNQVVLGDTFSFATTEEAWDVIQRILDTVDGVRNVEFRISEDSGVPYAMAVYRDPGQRTIAYNPEFMQKAVNNNWVSLAILAHEVGHHINPHLPIHPSTNFHQAELDADYFSGVVLAKLGATLEQAQEAVRLYGNPVATVDHPATSQRLQAIEEGWMRGRATLSPPAAAIQRTAVQLDFEPLLDGLALGSVPGYWKAMAGGLDEITDLVDSTDYDSAPSICTRLKEEHPDLLSIREPIISLRWSQVAASREIDILWETVSRTEADRMPLERLNEEYGRVLEMKSQIESSTVEALNALGFLMLTTHQVRDGMPANHISNHLEECSFAADIANFREFVTLILRQSVEIFAELEEVHAAAIGADETR